MFSSTKLSLLSCTSDPVPMIVLCRMGMMRVSLNLDDVANRVAKPWSFVVIMTMMIVSRSAWRVSPEKNDELISYSHRVYHSPVDNKHRDTCSYFSFSSYLRLVITLNWVNAMDV